MSDADSFSIDEIRSQLQSLGYDGITNDRLFQFQQDLSKLLSGNTEVEEDSWTGSSHFSSDNTTKSDYNVKNILNYYDGVSEKYL